MSGKIAIIIVSGLDQKPKVMSGLHVAKRIYDARKENDIETVEVFLFTGGVIMLDHNAENSDVLNIIKELRESNILIGACSNQVQSYNLEEQFKTRGINLEFARDAFSRYARENFTVITF